ncbi:hypothetical protein GCM10007301_48500 [Azorhizobium oxalatiphilum]|uniref:Uncharacterized protein n=1 Tax=Azorhizobium oxalatiphilum TaxID=980631 RepID=A0A917FHW6_9HYPH|nr:DUF1328 domain-containing protein [Azorhizobium oxalatiphilum]GGF82674.1 hypothetical protein GCM10007301_48500 [Azorhizobium oxalatiphilum]
MLKYAAIFLVLSIIAGAMGFVTVSQVARRVSLALFGIFLVIALAVMGFFVLLERATASEIMGPTPAKPASPLITMIAQAQIHGMHANLVDGKLQLERLPDTRAC